MTKEEKLQTEVITTEQAIYCMNHQYNYEKYECDYCPYCLLCEEKGIEGKMIKMAVKALETVRDLPSVAPTHGTCKDCKYWYRDGLSAISGNCEKLSHRERNSALHVEIERKTVETSYCSDWKRRGSEDEN